jgi:hypothetical protein
MKHIIYIYTTKLYKKEGWFKIGYTSVWKGNLRDSALARIAQQDNESNCESLELQECFDVTESWNEKIEKYPFLQGRLPDKIIHRELRLSGYNEREDKSREWFKTIDLLPIKEAIKKVVHEYILRKDFVPSFFQELSIARFMDAIENSESESFLGLAELCARFGKTKTFLEMFRRVNQKYGNDVLILPAYVLTVFPSFSKEIDETLQFKDMLFLDSRDSDYEETLNKFLGKKQIVIGVSLHMEDLEKLKAIKNIESNRKFLLIDEADFGAHTDKSKKVIDFIQ